MKLNEVMGDTQQRQIALQQIDAAIKELKKSDEWSVMKWIESHYDSKDINKEMIHSIFDEEVEKQAEMEDERNAR